MILLLASILFSTLLTVAFKICDRLGINKFQAILFNYFTCLVTGSVVNGKTPSYLENIGQAWFHWAVIMGIGFVVSFNMIAATVEKSGLAVASVASKLSLVLPFVSAIFLYQERVSALQIAGIGLAVLGVILTLFPHPTDGENDSGGSNSSMVLLPALVFFVTGLLDTLVKFVEKNFLDGTNNNDYLVTAFLAAFLGGLSYFLYQLSKGSSRVQFKAMLAGFLIGIPNYFSIWCLVKVLKMFPGQSAVFLPVNNMGIVICSALAATFIFREHLRRLNWIGIILSTLAICLIAFG